ncbi:MAG TPA: S8 family serine peptidase [Xanthomonadales bacterium]|nr:S8 family serine peptidase [Xanthomonadales bacterium]
MRFHVGAALLLLSTLALADKVEPDVRDALARAERVRVIAVLADDATQSDAARRAAIAARVDATLAALPAGRHALKRRFVRVPALAVEVDAVALERLAALPHVARVGLDAGGFGAMAQSAPLARVTDAFAAGLDGSGAKIAIVDSGLDTDHADFAGRLVAQQCFCGGADGPAGCCPNGAESMVGAGSAEDDHGHGTNVGGIAAGGGAAAARGAAPAASIVAVKVLDAGNRFCCASDVVAAFDWVRQNHPDTDVVNASLGTNALFATACDAAQPFTIALATAVDNLVANGTMVFASSGNQASPTSVAAPACLSGALAIGAVYDANLGTFAFGSVCTDATTAADKATCFTNSNALVDLYAPGARVTSSGRLGATATFSGTSQATPLAAGCAAALRAEFPEFPPTAIEAALEASPTTVVDAKSGLSFPRLDCAAAAARLAESVFADGFE